MRSHAMIKIETENAAFDPEPGRELARILRELADVIELYATDTQVTLRDLNGNKVGQFNHYSSED